MDLTLKDCSTDAPWVAATKKQRSGRSNGDMAALANKVGMHNAAHVNPGSMMDVDEPKGETEQYLWRQTGDDVEVTFKKQGLLKGDKKHVKVSFGKQRLKVEVKDEILLEGALSEVTIPDDCTWTLGDGVLQVTLAKASTGSWSTLLKV
jgi:hypothetical protein